MGNDHLSSLERAIFRKMRANSIGLIDSEIVRHQSNADVSFRMSN